MLGSKQSPAWSATKNAAISLIISSILVLNVVPAHADVVDDRLFDCLETLDLCDAALDDQVELVTRQEKLIQEQARQLEDIHNSAGGFQWEWFALGLAAGIAGGVAVAK